ncbi:zinc finger protein 318-like [Ambystoma mexicanum]|uniref:zinc finger protein 318-like n=1 Tax=Ambystoma mexicanum TaxID=8296 RepID=UPI0037E7E2D6
MERPRDKRPASPHGFSARTRSPHSRKPSHSSANGSRHRSPHRPREHRSPYISRSPHGSRPRSSHNSSRLRSRSPHRSRPRSPNVYHSPHHPRRSPHPLAHGRCSPGAPHPRSPHGSRLHSPHGRRSPLAPRHRSPHGAHLRSYGFRLHSPNGRQTPPGLASHHGRQSPRGPRPGSPHGHRSPLGFRTLSPRDRPILSPRGSRLRSPHSLHPYPSRDLRYHSPNDHRRSSPPPWSSHSTDPYSSRTPFPMSPHLRSSSPRLYPHHGLRPRSLSPLARSPPRYRRSPPRGPPHTEGHDYPLEEYHAGPHDPGDLRHRLTRPRGFGNDDEGWSPLSQPGKSVGTEILKITVGNDFYMRNSRETTHLSNSLDNVSDDSRENFPDTCILPRDHSLASFRSPSDEERRLSPLNIRNDADLQQPYPHRQPNRIDGDALQMSHPQEFESMTKKYILKNQNLQEPESRRHLQPESFLNSKSPHLPRHESHNPFLAIVSKPYGPQFYRRSIPLLSEDIFHNVQNNFNFLGREDHLLRNRDEGSLQPNRKASQDVTGVSDNLSMMMDVSGQGSVFSAMADEEAFLYGNTGHYGQEQHLSHSTEYSSVREQTSDVKEENTANPSSPSAPTGTQEETCSQKDPAEQKIHDLLKTIGLEIGDVDIGKLSDRTRERLYGKSLHSRERRSTEAPLQESSQMRSRSGTRSPESSHKDSRSPDRFSYADLEFSSRDEQPIPSLGQQQPIPSLGQQQPIPSLGQQQPIPSLGQQQPIPSLGQQQPIPSMWQQQSSPSTPVVLAPPQPTVYSVTNYAQYTTTHIAPSPVNIPSPNTVLPPHGFAPNKTVPPPTFVPNINMPPPFFFPPPQVQSYAQSPTAQVTPAQSPFIYNRHQQYMHAPESNWSNWARSSSAPARFALTLPHRSNLKVIQTVGNDSAVAEMPPQIKEQESTQSVPVKPKGATTKEPAPAKDQNRVAQRVKVLRDLSKLRYDRNVRQKKLQFLKKKIELLNTRHGDILKDKDQQNEVPMNPLLAQAKRLENELVELCKEAEKADEQQTSLEKVANILGLDISYKQAALTQTGMETTDCSTEVKPEVGIGTAK